VSGVGDALDAALDREEAGVVDVVAGPHRVRVDVVVPGAVGVRVREVRVDGPPGDVAERAYAIADGARGLGERIVPVEVAPSLGGAVLRTHPEAMEGPEFFDLAVGPGHTTVTRQRRRDDGGRDAVPFDLTRRDLRRLVERLAAPTER
jgi:hypothetical protein